MNIILLSLPINITLTVLIVVVVLGLFYFEHRFIKKREETIKKWLLSLIFLSSLLFFLAGALGIMLIWSYDINTFLSRLWSDIVFFFTDSVPALIGTAIAIFVWMLVLRVSKITLKRIGDRPGVMQKRRKTITKVSYSIINYTVAIIGIIAILAIWGVNVLPALAGLGIVGLVIGLGAQKFIQDLIAGFFIIFEHHFDVGDVIEVQGFKGTVTDIGLKTTKIRNWRGEIRIFNNGEVNTLINYSKNPSVAVVLFQITYDQNIDKVTEILNKALLEFRKGYPVIIEDPTVTGVINLAENGVELRVTAKTLNEQHYGIEREMRKFIKQTLDEHQIEIALKTVVVKNS